MIGNHQDRMSDGHRRALLAPPRGDPAILGSDIRLFAAGRPMRGFYQCLAEPGTAFARTPTESLAGTFLVARTHSGPRGEMLRSGEPLQIRADLGHEDLCRATADARDAI